MNVIYKLPMCLFGIVFIYIGIDIYKAFKLANASDLFDMIKYYSSSVNLGSSNVTILGVDAYFFLMMVGLFFAIVLSILRRNLLNIKVWVSMVVAVTFFLQAYFGAKLLYGIEMIMNAKSLNAFSMDGQSLYGTMPVTFIFILVLSKILKKDYNKLLDFVAPLWLTLLVFVRLGCYTVGCCGADSCTIFGTTIVPPVQLFEVAIDLVALQIIFNIENKRGKGIPTCITEGTSFYLMMMMYGGYRFILEFIRNNAVIMLGMTYGHIYSLICILVAIWCIDRVKRRTVRYV